MSRIIGLAAIVGLVGGLIGVWTVGRLSGEVGAAPPPPGDQKVREQNLDGSGFIRVHEQGTANVNVLSLPAEQPGRLIELGTQTFTLGGNRYQSAFVDVRDCRDITAMATASVSPDPSSGMDISFDASPDGTQVIPVELTGATRNDSSQGGVRAGSIHDSRIRLPFLRALVGFGGVTTSTVNATAWIWCQP